ncbi:LacI family DNA-binding transcriptional regulator [Paraflavisolibacter sp. H34]|uniref:LacI family DNA-binding transcriptional regulator n=1 Tax=Huijunlia imazamoxiresistens TaxID=3127457 RepID=UPI003016BB60
MRFEAITIKDIARALNLSVSTVSKALRGSHEISTETRKTVTDYAARHHYRPNPIAQSLKQGRSKSIGVVICNIDNNFFSQAINGMESVAEKKDYHVIITQSRESYESEVKSIRHLSSRSVDGLIVSLSAETEDIDHLVSIHDKGLPIVFFDRVAEQVNTHQVTCNNFKGAYEATLHLLSQGFRRIGHITSPSGLSITQERLQGYKKALEEKGIPFDEALVHYCQHGGQVPEETEAAVERLLQLPQRPDALLTMSDRITTTTLAYLHQLGIRVPDEIALIGFTNAATAGIFNPSLSAVVQPAFEIGQKAMELLIQLIESKRPVSRFEKMVFDTQLVIRDSSKRKEL